LVAFQIEALSKKYAKNAASFVSTESRGLISTRCT
jgi:hypothetical protein